MRLRLLLRIVLCPLLGASSVLAQGPPTVVSATAPNFRADSQAVSVDVVATHGNGEPIGSLQKQDFKVFEDGKPVAIDLFEEHNSVTGTDLAPPQLPPHVYSNLLASTNSDAVNVLLLDSLNTEQADQAFVHDQVVKYVTGMRPGIRIAVFTLNTRLRLMQGFTADISLLKATLSSKGAAPGTTIASRTRDDELRDKEEVSIIGEMANGSVSTGPAVESAQRALAEHANVQAGQRAVLTLKALEQLARYLAGVPGRKNVIWFAGSFPVSIFPTIKEQQSSNQGTKFNSSMRATADLLTASRVAVYPISAHGLQVDRTTNADSGGGPSGDDFARNQQQEAPVLAANTSAMEQLAHNTGGEAFYVGNDLSKVMANAIQNGSHYYTLVYTPPNKTMDGKFHRIEVKLTEGKARLSYRRGYYADSGVDATLTGDPLAPLLVRGMTASTQIVYQARVLQADPQPASDVARAGGNTKLTQPVTRYKVDIVINPTQMELDAADDGMHSGKLSVALVAYNRAGTPLNWTGNMLAINVNAASYARIQKSGIPVHLLIDLPSTDVFLATGVYDWTARRAGTMEIVLPVEPAGAAKVGEPPSQP